MKKITGLLTALCLVVPLIAIGGCDSGPASCRESLEHFYDQDCLLLYGGDPITVGEAISGCEDTRSYDAECGCTGASEDSRDCFASIGYQQCSACDYELDVYSTCINTCGGG